MSIFELNAAPVEPLDEIDADLHLAEATLFTIAAREASPAIVTISHPRGLRALQRMTAGEVQSLASSVCASFRIRTSITDVANEIQAQPIEMTIDASLEERVVGPRERILESVLLTHRATVLRSTSPQPLKRACHWMIATR